MSAMRFPRSERRLGYSLPPRPARPKPPRRSPLLRTGMRLARRSTIGLTLYALWITTLIVAGPALRTVSDATGGWAAHTLDGLLRHAGGAARAPTRLTYWQVGLNADKTGAHATAMRAEIETRVPQRVSADTANYFWVGSYLGDGSFIQVGYYVHSQTPTRAGWFYCAFYKNGRQGPCDYGAAGSAGDDKTRHLYSLRVVEVNDYGPIWQASLDDMPIGQFLWAAGETGANTPTIVAESSGFTPHRADSQLGPVDFPRGIETRGAGDAAYHQVAHVTPIYSAENVCPPYGIALDGHGGALLGSGLACPDTMSRFW